MFGPARPAEAILFASPSSEGLKSNNRAVTNTPSFDDIRE